MKKSSQLTVVAILMGLLPSIQAFAHGEDKLGPNGGFVRMPGAFHIEVVPNKKALNQIEVYLLDINWKNPSVESSKLKAKLVDAKTTDAKCTIDQSQIGKNHYICIFEGQSSLVKGKLVIESTREKLVGLPAEYELPLKLSVKP